MNISKKQLLDIISLSILAVSSKNDPTVCDSPEFNISSVESEILHIIPNNFELAETINEHIAAIRLGIKMAQEN